MTTKTFGDYSCLTENPNLLTAVANEDTIIMEIDSKSVHQFIALNPKNAEDMLRELSRQVAMIAKHVEMLQED